MRQTYDLSPVVGGVSLWENLSWNETLPDWNESLPDWNGFIPGWNEFIPGYF